jgi:hypothetical protein
VLNDQGKHRDAERELCGSVAIARRTLSADDRTLLLLIDSLASSLKAQERLAEAQPLMLEALEGKRRSLGSSHPDTLSSINNYALLLVARGEAARA